MKAKVYYGEIVTYVKNHYKVSPELRRIDDKTIEAFYKPVKFMPAISMRIKIGEVRGDILSIVYDTSTTASLIIEKAVEGIGSKLPKGIDVSTKDRRVTLYLSQIEKTKKIMDHIYLENVYVDNDNLELSIGLK